MTAGIDINGESGFRPYTRRPGNEVIAVRLELDTDGFDYRKWPVEGGRSGRCWPPRWRRNHKDRQQPG